MVATMATGISTFPNPRPNQGGYLSALLHGLHTYSMDLCMGYDSHNLLIKHGGWPVCMGCMG
jgi:hypothetical protein